MERRKKNAHQGRKVKDKVKDKTKNKSSLIDWLNSNMLRPVVIGDENFAFRLRAYIGSHESFSHFDAESLMSPNYEPNLLLVIGPLNEGLKNKLALYKKNNKTNVLYIESVMNESEEELAVSTSEELGAKAHVIKEFVEVSDVVRVLKELANV